MTINEGHVFWLTGLAGAGKSTLGEKLTHWLRGRGKHAIFLDGDVLRMILGDLNNFDMASRLELALIYCRLCRELSIQGTNVVCSTMSLFPEVWTWNRENIAAYTEIYVRVPIEVLIERNQKGIYSAAISGERDDVIGVNLPFTEPTGAHVIIDNDGTQSADAVFRSLLQNIEPGYHS